MNANLIKLFFKASLTLAVAFTITVAKADDPGDPGDVLGGGGSGQGAQIEGVPVDGGASFLAFAGASYAARRLRKKKEQKQTEPRNA